MKATLARRLGEPRLWLFAGVLLACSWPFPYFEKLGSPNEISRLYLTRAIVDDGSFALDHQVARYGHITDLAHASGHLYSDKAPGIGLLGVPVYLAVKALAGWRAQAVSNRLLLRLLRLLLAALPTAVLAVLLFSLLQRLLVEHGLRLWLSVSYALGSVAYPYGVLLYGHQAAALCLLAAFYLLSRPVPPRSRGWLLVGLALAGSVTIEYTTVLLALPLALLALWRARGIWRRAAWALAGAALAGGLLAFYHTACFGHPLATGYTHLLHDKFAAIHRRGLFGLVTPAPARLGNILFSPNRGLWFFSPWLLPAPLGLVAGLLRPAASGWRGHWLALLAASLLYLLFAASLQLPAWGWSLGPRHLAPLIPFWVLGAGRLLGPDAPGRNWTRRLAWVLGLYSAAALVTPTLVFGGYPPDFSNPLADFIGPLLLAGCIAPSLGSELGLSTATAGWLLLAAVAAALLFLLWRQSAARLEKLTCLAAALVLIGVVFSWTGPPATREQHTRTWVRDQIMHCPPAQPQRGKLTVPSSATGMVKEANSTSPSSR